MASEKNITMRQFNGVDYDTLYPKTKVEQVEGAYTQQQILSNATAALYGLGTDAVPDDVLALFGMHCWERTLHNFQLTYGKATTTILCSSTNSGSSTETISYSSSVNIGDDGVLSLVNPSTITVNMDSPGGTTLAGKYFKIGSAIYYADTDASASTRIEGSYYQVVIKDKTKSVSVYDNAVQDFVRSTDRNAYPDSGSSGGYEYQYCGVPFYNASRVPVKIVTGSYTGTDTYGESNPNSLTFDFAPQVIYVQSKNSGNGFILPSAEAGGVFYPINDCTMYTLSVSVSGTTVSWYLINASLARGQLNVSGVKYTYIAIG